MTIYQAYYKTKKGFSVDTFDLLKDARAFCYDKESLVLRKDMQSIRFLSIYNNWIPCDYLSELLNEQITDSSIHDYNLQIKSIDNKMSQNKHKWNLY